MAFFDSKVSKFRIDDTGSVLRDLSAYLTEVRGLPGARGLNEVTALGDSGAKYIAGLEDVAVTLSGMFDNTATTGPDAVLGPLRTHSSAVDFEYGPEGATSGDVKYSGTCWVTSYALRSRVGDLVGWSAALQVDGTVTRGTF
jgi:hypothetical protein